jgi:tetratricopeptide (TPR) repeat protein
MKKIKQKQTGKISRALDLAQEYKQTGNFQGAESIYRKILREQPNNSRVCFDLAFVLQEKGGTDEAVAYYQRALKLNPLLADASYNLGSIFHQKGLLDEAAGFYEEAIRLNERHAHAHNNLGSILQQKGLFDEAICFYEKAVQLNPGLVSAYNNLGLVLQEKGLFGKAMEYHQKALSFQPDHPAVHFNIAGLLLMQGDYEKGWKEYEWRRRSKDYLSRNFNRPLWDGSDISGRTVLLYSEKGFEGFGDTIQFVRYARLIAELGGKVVVESQKELKTLLKNIKGVEEVVSYGEKLPVFDLHCPYLSLPFVFSTTLDSVPSTTPYITPDPVSVLKWKDRISHDDSILKIGLAWAGNLNHPRARYRSSSLKQFSPLAKLDGITIYSLQKGEAAQEAATVPHGLKFVDYTADFNDFSDAAALAENLDLVVSVDTAAAHLAGALGKPVLMLLPFLPEWRWLLDREDSPWYPTMKILRQSSPGDWEGVISRLLHELESILHEKN